jgi:acyl-CoA dehydrogenase
MSAPTHLEWPFFDDGHRAWAQELARWVHEELPALPEPDERDLNAVYAACRARVRALGAAGLLRACVPAAFGGLRDRVDVRSLALAREVLAHAGALADFAFAMQGLGSVPVSLFGSDAQRAALLPEVARGDLIAAFALSEPEAGSDVAAMQATARRARDAHGEHWVLDGTKTWISNAGGLADRYVVFARSEGLDDPSRARDAKGLSAFLVDAGTPGLDDRERIPVISPHPLGVLKLAGCRVGADRLLGQPGQGFAIAMGTLDLFRTTVGAAALGFARRALDEATARARHRHLFGQRLADFQLTQQQIGRMCTDVDAAALMVYRSAWTRDVTGRRVTREASMAKLHATESAQQVIDAALQLHGGLGLVSGQPVERLYRDVRALRIYEGASEVLQLVIGGRHLVGDSP